MLAADAERSPKAGLFGAISICNTATSFLINDGFDSAARVRNKLLAHRIESAGASTESSRRISSNMFWRFFSVDITLSDQLPLHTNSAGQNGKKTSRLSRQQFFQLL